MVAFSSIRGCRVSLSIAMYSFQDLSSYPLHNPGYPGSDFLNSKITLGHGPSLSFDGYETLPAFSGPEEFGQWRCTVHHSPVLPGPLPASYNGSVQVLLRKDTCLQSCSLHGTCVDSAPPGVYSSIRYDFPFLLHMVKSCQRLPVHPRVIQSWVPR